MANMGDVIKNLRTQANMTQDELGKMIGVQKSAIAKYESGRVQNLKKSTIKKMADIFNVDPSYILGIEKEQRPSDKDLKLLEIYLRAKKSDKATVKTLVEAIDKLLGIDEQ